MNGGVRRLLGRTLQGRIGASLVLDPVVVASYRWHRRTGATPALGYSAMRKLFGSPRGWRLDRLADDAAREQPPLPLADAQGLIGDPQDQVLGALERDGLARLETRLRPDDIAALTALAREAPCRLIERSPDGPVTARFDPERPQAVRYDIPEPALVESDVVQRLVADTSILSIAQGYLGGPPVQDLVAMWWSAPSAHGSSAAAQQFHFDLDRLRFLKLFVYLTDVGPENGPHVFVRGSHRSLPRALRQDRRFSDEEVLAHYDEDDLVHLTGPAGTMFLADTRGLHKGLNVTVGHRLVFQLEYAISLFGIESPRMPIRHLSPELSTAMARFPTAYRRFEAPPPS